MKTLLIGLLALTSTTVFSQDFDSAEAYRALLQIQIDSKLEVKPIDRNNPQDQEVYKKAQNHIAATIEGIILGQGEFKNRLPDMLTKLSYISSDMDKKTFNMAVGEYQSKLQDQYNTIYLPVVPKVYKIGEYYDIGDPKDKYELPKSVNIINSCRTIVCVDILTEAYVQFYAGIVGSDQGLDLEKIVENSLEINNISKRSVFLKFDNQIIKNSVSITFDRLISENNEHSIYKVALAGLASPFEFIGVGILNSLKVIGDSVDLRYLKTSLKIKPSELNDFTKYNRKYKFKELSQDDYLKILNEAFHRNKRNKVKQML